MSLRFEVGGRMKRGRLPELRTLCPGLLDQFTTDLIRSGFEVVPGTSSRDWEGPAPESLRGHPGGVDRMTIRLRDGWPFLHPHVVLAGANLTHMNGDGVLCLWTEDDNSRSWLSLSGICERIDSFCSARPDGEAAEGDQVRDAFLAFSPNTAGVALLNHADLFGGPLADGSRGSLHGLSSSATCIEIRKGRGRPKHLHGEWYYRESIPLPPRNIEEFARSLTSAQRRSFESGLAKEKAGHRRGLRIALLAWPRANGHDVQVLRMSSEGNMTSISPAFRDESIRRMRAGPDVKPLGKVEVALFGCGAVGSHLGLVLAKCGLGHLRLFDGGILRPGNVVRHALSTRSVGRSKVEGLAFEVRQAAPWTECEVLPGNVHDARMLAEIARGADLMVDTTGSAAFLDLIATVADRYAVPLVSAALFRGGSIGRVRRQVPGHDIPIHDRSPGLGFVPIPPGPEPPSLVETGCSAPVNNASPASVLAVASLACQVVVDCVSERRAFSSEVVDVYQPLDTEPFDAIARLQFPGE